MELAAGFDRYGNPLGQSSAPDRREALAESEGLSLLFRVGDGERQLTDDPPRRGGPERDSGRPGKPTRLEVQSLGEGLIAGDFPRPPSRPCRLTVVSSVEGVMDDHLPLREELDVRATDAEVGNLFMLKPIIGRHDVEGLAHR